MSESVNLTNVIPDSDPESARARMAKRSDDGPFKSSIAFKNSIRKIKQCQSTLAHC